MLGIFSVNTNDTTVSYAFISPPVTLKPSLENIAYLSRFLKAKYRQHLVSFKAPTN